ncbi:MAG: hypothetical protein IKN04_08370 [Clostridia bacterium]|nr:hypothetical protein [Clostridia bacterium]
MKLRFMGFSSFNMLLYLFRSFASSMSFVFRRILVGGRDFFHVLPPSAAGFVPFDSTHYPYEALSFLNGFLFLQKKEAAHGSL